ncbi:rhodanese-like domain-containing protein [Marinomonas epiphytica]
MTQTIQPKEAYALIQQGKAILVDVREAHEYQEERIANALSLPLSSIESQYPNLHVPADTIVIIQCLRGSRGEQAVKKIAHLVKETNQLTNLSGGINGWKDAGLNTITENTSNNTTTLSINRQVQIAVGLLILLFTLLGFYGFTFGFVFAGLFGAGLCFAGLSGWCGMGLLLMKMPWNKT